MRTNLFPRLEWPEELRHNRAIQFLIGLMPALLAGVVCVALVRRPIGAWLFGALTLTGIGVGGWFARRGTSARDVSSAPQQANTNIGQGSLRLTADFARGSADTVLVLEMRPVGPSTTRDAAEFLALVQPFSESQADSSLRLEQRNLSQDGSRQLGSWTLTAHADQITARFVHIPLAAESQPAPRTATSSVLRQMRLHRRIVIDFLRTMLAGRSVVTGRLKAVVLCCALTDLRRHLDTMIAVAGRELDAVGKGIAGRFPMYVVATDLQQIGGFAEFTTVMKSRFGVAVLDQAVGVALDRDQRSKDALHQQLLGVSERLATWRPALLQAIDEHSRREIRQGRTSDSTARKALTYEFPRQLAMFATTLTDFCWRAVGLAQGNERGPVLRGVFFTGLVMPDISPFMQSIAAAEQFERRAFAWNLLTRHLAEPASEVSSDFTR